MKITCMISSLGLGGAERQMVGLATALAGAGHDVEVLTYRKGNFYVPVLKEAGVRHVRISRRGGTFPLVRRIASHLKESGCEMLISFLAGTNIKACMVHRRWPHFRLIVSERNHNLRQYPHDTLRFIFYKEADGVVCNNYSQEAFIKAHRPSLAAVLRTIPNFVDTEAFRPADKESGDETPKRIVVTARLANRKNALGLIRAAAIMKNVGRSFQLDWYGLQKEDRYYRSCRSLIEMSQLGDCFHIHPATREVSKAYAEADVFCLPSFYEGTSNSLAEAMASGLPVVCSDTGDNTRYAHTNVNGFVFDPHRPESIALALEKAISLNRENLAVMGGQSRSIACSELSKEAFSSRWISLVKEYEQ